MGEIVKIKHLLYTIGGMVVFAFGLGANVNSRLGQVDKNKTDIIELKSHRGLDRKLIIDNHSEVMQEFFNLKLELKLELKDKQNRNN